MKEGKAGNSCIRRSVLKLLSANAKATRRDLNGKPFIGQDVATIFRSISVEPAASRADEAEFVDAASAANTEVVAVTAMSSIRAYKKSLDEDILAVYSCVNHCVAAGAIPLSMQVSLILPTSVEEADLKRVMMKLNEHAKSLRIGITGGQTTVDADAKAIFVNVFMTATRTSSAAKRTGKVAAGDSILMAGVTGLAGARRLSGRYREEFLKKYRESVLDRALGREEDLSLMKIGSVCANGLEKGLIKTAYAAGEGGIEAALWNLSEKTGKGFEVQFNELIMRQGLIEFTEFIGANPYRLNATGAMLLVVTDAESVMEALKQEDVPVALIGTVTDASAKVLKNSYSEQIRNLDKPQVDEYYHFR